MAPELSLITPLCRRKRAMLGGVVSDALRFTGRVVSELCQMAWSSVAAGPDGIPRSSDFCARARIDRPLLAFHTSYPSR